eukprot:PhM_4_TR9147/c1_g1_i2/m.90236
MLKKLQFLYFIVLNIKYKIRRKQPTWVTVVVVPLRAVPVSVVDSAKLTARHTRPLRTTHATDIDVQNKNINITFISKKKKETVIIAVMMTMMPSPILMKRQKV